MSNFYLDNKGLKVRENNISVGSHHILSSGLVGNYRYIPNNVDQWSLVAHTYNSNTIGYNHYIYYCYNNTIFIVRSSKTGIISTNTAPVYIGDNNFGMNVGKVGLYNRALDLSEIKKIYLKTKLVYGLPNEPITIKRVGCIYSEDPAYDNQADTNYGCLNYGCTDPYSINYNPSAIVDDGSCEYS